MWLPFPKQIGQPQGIARTITESLFYPICSIQAYITIKKNNSGQFQFGLVRGYFNIENIEDDRLEFEWKGSDEMDEASGSGWVKLKSANEIEGHFSFHFMGDDSTFLAIRKK